MPDRYIVCLQYTKKAYENTGGWAIEFGHTTKEFTRMEDAQTHVRKVIDKGCTVYIEDGVRTLEAYVVKDGKVEKMVMPGGK